MLDPRGEYSTYERLADILSLDISYGWYAPGEPLPSEATLMRTYDVTRYTVRLAMAHLRDEGLVKIRPGRVVYVNDELWGC